MIRDTHYDEVEAQLRDDPIVIDMAATLPDEPMEFLHEDGTPRFEFMQAANREYDRRGGTITERHIGAVARALWLVKA